jgi:cellobiose-specific phosphotransferase system component IIC
VNPHSLAAGTRVAFLLGGATATLGVVFAFFITEKKQTGETSSSSPQLH